MSLPSEEVNCLVMFISNWYEVCKPTFASCSVTLCPGAVPVFMIKDKEKYLISAGHVCAMCVGTSLWACVYVLASRLF